VVVSTAFRDRLAGRTRAELLAELISLRDAVVVAGAHGKTTTAAMIAFALERLGLDPERRLLPLAFPRGYRAAVEAQARTARVPVHLAYALIRAESVFDPAAVSPVGARGLMQLMPATAETLAPALGATPFDADLLFDPEANVRFGVTLLGRLLAKYPGRPDLAVAAYNAGPEAVARWIEAFGQLAEDEFVESIPFTETRGYVMKVTANWQTYDALYGQP
jgi:soluble lytic murein transglycosylase